MTTPTLKIPNDLIEAFCKKWKIAEFSLFGSILRDDFSPTSDVDVLVSFLPGKEMTLKGFIDMRRKLSEIFGGHEVDLVEKNLVRNPFRRHEILTTRQVVYSDSTEFLCVS